MPWSPTLPKLTAAKFSVLDGPSKGHSFDVQFNPASLELTISNELDERNVNNKSRQFVKKASTKLAMTLVFDTTETGASVRLSTGNFSDLLQPQVDTNDQKKNPPLVQFRWGTYNFSGVIEQFKETIDLFSADGVPLRSSVNLTMSSQDIEFQSSNSPVASFDRKAPADPVPAPLGANPSGIASQLGDPRLARLIAGANGAASLRFSAGASLAVGGGVSLAAAADFSAGASASLSVGGGAGLSIGAGASAGVGFGAGLGVSAGAGFSAGAGVDIGATAGAAFTGLRVGASASTSITPDIASVRAALLPAASPVGGAMFGVGGVAVAQASAGLTANVGLGASLNFGD